MGDGTISETNRQKLIEYVQVSQLLHSVVSKQNDKQDMWRMVRAIILEGGEGATWVIDGLLDYGKTLEQRPKAILSVVLDPKKIKYPAVSSEVEKLEWCDFVTREYTWNQDDNVDIVWVGTEVNEYRDTFAFRVWKLLKSGGVIVFSNSGAPHRIHHILTKFVEKVYSDTEKICIYPFTNEGIKSTVVVIHKR